MSIAADFARIINDGHGKGDHAVIAEMIARNYVLHCPDGSTKGREESRNTFGALRNALSDFTLRCDPVLVDGNLLSARTIMEGRFTEPFVMEPMGRAEPNGRAIHFETISIFRFDDRGLISDAPLDRCGTLPRLIAAPTSVEASSTITPAAARPGARRCRRRARLRGSRR